jgi:membrane protease YdiL (CAAX protease family)
MLRPQTFVAKILAPKFEPFTITGGIFLFTLLYYTRKIPLQIVSFIVLILVTALWAHTIRQRGLSWSDFKLSKKQLWLQVIIALGLSIFGWFYFRQYVIWTRGTEIPFGYGGNFLAVITIVLVASTEEIYFRGYLQNRIQPHFRMLARVLIAVFAMAFYKNIVHIWEGMSLLAHLELLFVGILHNILPSLWMEWSDNLWGALLLHVFWDLLVYAPLIEIPYWVF